MLKKRLIPKLLIKHRLVGRTIRPVLVTTRGYRDVVEVGDAVSQAKIYEAQLADELIVLNIDRAPIRDDETMLSLIERLASETFMPLCVGGGVKVRTTSGSSSSAARTKSASTRRRSTIRPSFPGRPSDTALSA